MNRKTWGAITALASLALSCGSEPATDEDIEQRSEALNACGETVPDDRIVDGIPAYAQCDGISSGDIWSNNGVDTSSTSGGDGWFRTQRGGGYQCTELARRYLYFVWGINYQHGNAQEWCDGELPPTLALSSTPVHGDLIVFEGGVCGAAESTGHIALIDEVDLDDARVTFIEQNRAGRRSSDIDCAKCFLHVVENDGTAGSSAGAGGASGSGGSGAAGTPGEGGMAAFAGEPGSSAGAGTGGIGGSGMEPPLGGTAGAAASGSGGSTAASGGMNAGGAGAGGGVSAGGSPPSSGGAGAGGSTAGQPGIAGTAANTAGSGGSGAGSAGSAGVEAPGDVRADDEAGVSCSATGARRGAGAPVWFGVVLAGLALRLRRRVAASVTHRPR